MDDSAAVRLRHPFCERNRDLEDLAHAEAAPLLEQLIQRSSLDELHRDEGRSRGNRRISTEAALFAGLNLAHLEDDADRRMIERRGGPRLPQEPRPRLAFAPDLRGDELERHRTPELHVDRAVHHTHSALSQQLELGVPREHRAPPAELHRILQRNSIRITPTRKGVAASSEPIARKATRATR
jgi:hypothetical protein